MQPSFRLACEVSWDVDAPRKPCGGGLLDDRRVQTLVAVTLYEAGAPDDESIETSVSFLTPQQIQELNREHRDVDAPTDVLSFPIDGLEEDLPPGMPRALGDVVICPEYVQRQLEDGTTMQDDATLEAALERCLVHGMLHLAGFDHERSEQDAEHMFALEQLVLDRARART